MPEADYYDLRPFYENLCRKQGSRRAFYVYFEVNNCESWYFDVLDIVFYGSFSIE